MSQNQGGYGYGPPPQYPQQSYPQQQQQYPQHYQQPYPYPYPYPPQQMPAIYIQQNAGTVVVKAPFNHGVHLVLDVITCGAWLPLHLLIWAIS